MGTEVHCKSSFEGYYSMRDVNEDSNSSSWPLFYGDNKALTNGHYYNGFVPRTVADAYPGRDKEAIKQKMLEHEAIFKNQVFELHRLYRRQRDMMEEVKRKEYHKHRMSVDASSSSSLLPSQRPYEDGHKWQIPSFPLTHSTSARPSIFGAEKNNSPLSCSKENNSIKDSKGVEGRPSKVRKKLFDLELPPDDNVDHDEHEEMQYKQPSEESSYKDTSSGQFVKGSNGLADLNEPIHVEEAVAHASVKPRGPQFNTPSGELFGKAQSGRANGPFNPSVSQFISPTGEYFEKAQNGQANGAINHSLLEGKSNGRDWLSNMRETGNSRSNMKFTPGTYTDHSRFNQTSLPFPPSRTNASYPYMNATDLANSWGKPNGSFTNKLTSFQKQPSFLSSPQSHGIYGDKWRMNGCYTPNGFHHGSSSGSKDVYTRLPSDTYDQRNRNNLEDKSHSFFKGSNFIDLTGSNIGIDLNDDSNTERKCDKTVPPWLQNKPVICNKDSRLDNCVENNGKILGNPVFGNSCVSKNESSSLVSTSASLRCLDNGKIKMETENRGFDMNVAWDDPENKQIDVEDVNLEKETDKIKNHFDLNSCLTEDDDLIVRESDKSSSEKMKTITMDIDLEAPAVPEAEEEETINEVKKIDDFDYESVEKMAAEAMVAMIGISNQQDQVGSTSEVAVCSDDNEIDKGRLLLLVEAVENARSVSNELDEYEELTLQLEETKEEDYMPKPLAPDFPEPVEAGPTRPRRGQARRGRPRRDFQRDILPGLVSLSRHEVTEDLQTFGGLMKATGHSWNVGLTRRNGTRGRRKSVAVAVEPPPPAIPPPPPPPAPPLSEQLNNMEAVGLDERSLTGWGKTTRRPRRQRCAAGTSVAVVPLM
uniref:Uncharacterized protein n=1 Tax=Tanacetum cinerariifolium TaxID=118510 RepID=A0A6L2JE78_TANCI|nr:hypothetical protein [Tanacetum cinerariifolium]GEW08634.1 hypothetical protein [Tanacetum cinerariifolium]